LGPAFPFLFDYSTKKNPHAAAISFQEKKIKATAYGWQSY
jgi:hypothetical protein